jgi:hypothetical protein
MYQQHLGGTSVTVLVSAEFPLQNKVQGYGIIQRRWYSCIYSNEKNKASWQRPASRKKIDETLKEARKRLARELGTRFTETKIALHTDTMVLHP